MQLKLALVLGFGKRTNDPLRMCSLSMNADVGLPLARVDGWPINVATVDDAVQQIAADMRKRSAFSVVTLNLDHIVKLRSDETFRSAYRAAKFISADGAPVAHLARKQCTHIERAPGADLLLPLCREAADGKIGVYLFGTDSVALKRSADRLSESTGGRLNICGAAAPAMKFDPQGPEADAALDKIAASGAGLCFVALGAPKQEIFAARALERGIKAGFICVGAGLDFLAGRQVRAPQVMRNNGLEWLWRLSRNPGRLTARYAKCGIILVDLWMLGSVRHFRTGLRRS